MSGTTYHLTGRTYHNRAWLRQYGAQWDADARRWTLNVQGNGTRRPLQDLRNRGICIRAAQA